MKRSALPLVRGRRGLIRTCLSSELIERGKVCVCGVAGAVVGHHGLDADAVFGEPGHCVAQEADCAVGGQIIEDLGVGEA